MIERLGRSFDGLVGGGYHGGMVDLPKDLREALDGLLSRYSPGELAKPVQKLMRQYREGFDPSIQVLGSDTDVAAYAAYRMPATYSAAFSAFDQTAAVASGFAPRSQFDIGGGTGAAIWASTQLWPSLERITVLEQATGAIALGRRLTRQTETASLRNAEWRRGDIGKDSVRLPADLVTVSYVLGELPPETRADIVKWLAANTEMLVLIEPGTPAGYARVIAARSHLIDLGLTIVAPCPHGLACPIAEGTDWCHFSARLNRTSLHRQVKSGTLNFEDEKFSYVAASRRPWPQVPGRVIRHPMKRKGLVSFPLCNNDGRLLDSVVSRSKGAVYKAARDIAWGDPWPPAD